MIIITHSTMDNDDGDDSLEKDSNSLCDSGKF